MLNGAAPLIQERIETLSQGVEMLRFLLVDDDQFVVDETEAAKVLTAEAQPILDAAQTALSQVDEWNTAAIEAALRAALVEDLGSQAAPRLWSTSTGHQRTSSLATVVRVDGTARTGHHDATAGQRSER